jgi:formate-dependent nitrite reductase cytochrome c552 subunit
VNQIGVIRILVQRCSCLLGADKCIDMMKKLRRILNKLYDHYNFEESSSQVQHGIELPQDSSMKIEENKNANLLFMNRLHKYLASKSDTENKSEMDRYLIEDVEKQMQILIF